MIILLLGAGEPQEHFIAILKKQGHKVYLLSYDHNPIAKKFADTYFQISTLDIDAVYDVAKENCVDRIIAVCTDQALYTMSYVSSRLNKPCYLTTEQVEICTKKSKMKKFMSDNGISSSNYYIVLNHDIETLKNLNFPVVIKPSDCNSSKGVRIARSDEELYSMVDSALTLSRTKTAVVEEYVCGKELTVDGFIVDGVFHLLLVSRIEKRAVKDADFLVVGTETLPQMEAKDKDRIISICQRITDGLEIKSSPFIAQMIVDEDDFKVVEFSLRTGGGEKYRVIEEASGISPLKELANLMLGNKIHVAPKEKKDILKTCFIYGRHGKIQKIIGLEDLKKCDVILAYYVYKDIGTEIDGEIKSSGDRIVGFTIKGASEDEINYKMSIAIEKIDVLDADGNSMIYRFDEP